MDYIKLAGKRKIYVKLITLPKIIIDYYTFVYVYLYIGMHEYVNKILVNINASKTIEIFY